ncbi:TPA: cell wall-binding repeat-containing protein [Clostridioides difficile]|nr:cell wall-binding repeat-containing protein [Clostridioides difficile]MBY1216283.1 cell wall-binding repeat-containing protein [Clostridioides difficile]MBZ0912174.1 cell wall-binding repeat-containing protein [Clostridioides difficile]MBZ1031854.1 cell wall-binding repeat-containing protein [Clostridioides difficile]MDE3490760.1 cell wall-binding repeat-containing protein [Clostridioides difficile]
MKVSKKVMLLLTISFISTCLYTNKVSAATKDTLVGSGRWETAIKISQKGWSSSTNAVLVNDNSISDALSSTPFARVKDAPILLTQNDKLDNRTKLELKRLGVKNVYLIGGINALSQDIEKELKLEGISFERISGNDRYDTSVKLAEKLDKEKKFSSVFVVSGKSGLADAVSIGSIAAQEGMPIILSNPENGIKLADKLIKEKNINKSYIIGGKLSVSESVEQNLPNVKRISGNNRNETNAKVIEEFYKSTNLKNAYITKDGMRNQSDLIDSLAVGVLASKNSSPVVLVGEELDSAQKDIMNTKIFDKITQVGGLGNESATKSIADMQEQTKYTVESIEELNVALKKADANDVIKFKAEKDKKVTDSFKLETKKAITIEFDGTYTQTITIDMPNGDINNFGKIDGSFIINNIKNNTLVNKGDINQIDVYSKNGCRIENQSSGDIWLITILKEAKNVYIENDGDIIKISNSSNDVTLKNYGSVDKISGNKELAIIGNKPRINDTIEDDKEKASGLYPEVKSCTPAQSNFIMLHISQEPKYSDYAIYYRVVKSKPSAIKIGDKIDIDDWDIVKGTTPFKVNAINGSYIECVEIDKSNKSVRRWGRTGETNDGVKVEEVAKGLDVDVNIIGENVKITTPKANLDCKIYYRISEIKPTAMNVGEKINLSSWDSVIGNYVELKINDVEGKYIELVELDNSNNLVTRWGKTDKIVVTSSEI